MREKGRRLGDQLAREKERGRKADLNIDSFYLNSVLLSPVGYLPLELDAITKSEMWIERIGWIGARTRARREKGHFGVWTKALRGRERV